MPSATEKALEQLKKMEEMKQAAINEQLEIIKQANETLELLGYSKKPSGKRALKKCSICGSDQHTKRTHPK